MNIWDILIILIIAGAAFLAFRKRKKGSCSCGCAGCPSASCCGKKGKGAAENEEHGNN